MMSNQRKMRLAEGMLLLTAMIWGSGFVVMKNALDWMPVHFLLGTRFIIAAVIMSLFLYKKLVKQRFEDVLRGSSLGVVMYAAYAVQTYGLQHTTAGQNAFLTAVYVILVPLFVCLYTRKKASALQISAAVLCIVGIGLLALENDLSIGIGNALSLLCGILYAIHIVMVNRFSTKTDPLVLTAMQFNVCGVMGLMSFLLLEKPPAQLGGNAIASLAYLAIVGTLLALTMQNVGIRYADPSHASLIMGTESLFGALFGSLFLLEPITMRMFFGCALIMVSIVLSEVRVTGNQKRDRIEEPVVEQV